MTVGATTAGVATKRDPTSGPYQTRPLWPRAPPRLPDGERLSWPTLQKTASIKERGGLNTQCVPVLRASLSVTPAPCDCNTAESESDDREESRLNL